MENRRWVRIEATLLAGDDPWASPPLSLGADWSAIRTLAPRWAGPVSDRKRARCSPMRRPMKASLEGFFGFGRRDLYANGASSSIGSELADGGLVSRTRRAEGAYSKLVFQLFSNFGKVARGSGCLC